MKRWVDISITRKLYFVIGAMGLLLAAELVTLRFAMHTLSAVRALVGGEGSWSKAQKNAAIALERYVLTRDEADYQSFVTFLQVPEGDHIARIELQKPDPDREVVRQGFLAGRMHADDIDQMIELLRRFSRISYLARAIRVWAEGDELLARFKRAGEDYHDIVHSPSVDGARASEVLSRIEALNAELTRVEDAFSASLSEGSRWMERVLITLLMVAVLAVESVGLSLTLLTTRRLSHGLAAIQAAATRIGAGDFAQKVEVRSHDEVGLVGEGINRMGALLHESYADLETRVRERTAELASMAQENERLYRQANDAVKMRDEFFSIASHELRTPLTALQLRLQVLGRMLDASLPPGIERERTEEAMDVCLRQARRLSVLSAELMDLTRIRIGKLSIARESCDLVAITRDVVAELAGEAASAGCEIRLSVPDAASGWWDPIRLGQMVRNLISNAIKYGEGGLVEVSIASDESREVVRLAVRDHGQGVAPEDRARIFERFQRAEPGGRIPGLGLGLYVTQQIAIAHGGAISVENASDGGAVFILELKLENGSTAATTTREESIPVVT